MSYPCFMMIDSRLVYNGPNCTFIRFRPFSTIISYVVFINDFYRFLSIYVFDLDCLSLIKFAYSNMKGACLNLMIIDRMNSISLLDYQLYYGIVNQVLRPWNKITGELFSHHSSNSLLYYSIHHIT